MCSTEISNKVTDLEEADGNVENNDCSDNSAFDPILDTVRQGHSSDQYESESIGCLVDGE